MTPTHDASGPTSIVVRHDGHAAALCTAELVFVAPAIDKLATDDPTRIAVQAKCLVAGAILRGDVAGPYDDREADDVARALIVDRRA